MAAGLLLAAVVTGVRAASSPEPAATQRSRTARVEQELARSRELRQQVGYAVAGMGVVLLLLFGAHQWHTSRQLKRKNAELERLKRQEHEARMKEHEARQQAEAARRTAEAALQMKRRFLNNVSHELRTPLNAISGFSQVLLSQGDDLDGETKAELECLIVENTELLTGIVDKMIELSHYDSLASLPFRDAVAVNALCREVADVYRHRTSADVTLRFATTLADEALVMTNREGVQKVLGHVLDNAVRFTTRGSIALCATREPASGRLVLAVTDTGPGIPEERRRQVFDLFTETGEVVKTTGMGLSICRSICRLLGGTIAIAPDYADGTRIIVELPWREPKNGLQ